MNLPAAGHVSPEEECRGSEAGISASWHRWSRPLVGALVLCVLVLRLGTAAFVDAFRSVDLRALAAGVLVAAVTTTAAAWRWRVVARQLRAELSMPSAVAGCYRSQFLNVTLPGGVLGDVNRGIGHGRVVEDLGRGLRAVAWERASGQAVLALVTLGALVVANPVGPELLLVAVAGLAASAFLLLGLTRVSPVVAADARSLGASSAVVQVVVASLVVLAGHVVTFALAARSAGVRMPARDFVPLALVVLVVAAVPLNLAGWGPREGAAAWAFGAAGATAAEGVAVAVVFGVLVFAGALPGAALLLAGRSRREAAAKVGGRHTGTVSAREVAADD